MICYASSKLSIIHHKILLNAGWKLFQTKNQKANLINLHSWLNLRKKEKRGQETFWNKPKNMLDRSAYLLIQTHHSGKVVEKVFTQFSLEKIVIFWYKVLYHKKF